MDYYQHNTLGNSFPGVDTTLKCSVKDTAEGLLPGVGLSSSGTPASGLSYRPTLPSHQERRGHQERMDGKALVK